MPGGSSEGVAKCRPTRINRQIRPPAQVCQRAGVTPVATSPAIRAAAAGRFIQAASEPGGGAPAVSPGSPVPGGTADSATRARAAGCSSPDMRNSSRKAPGPRTPPRLRGELTARGCGPGWRQRDNKADTHAAEREGKAPERREGGPFAALPSPPKACRNQPEVYAVTSLPDQ